MTQILESPTVTTQYYDQYWTYSDEWPEGTDRVDQLHSSLIPEGTTEILPKTVLESGVTQNYHVLLAKGELVPFTARHVIREYCENSHPTATGEAKSSGSCTTGIWLSTKSSRGGITGGLVDVRGTCPDPTLDSFDPLLTKALGEANTGALLILLELAESPKTVRLVANAVFTFKKRREKLLRLLRKKYKTRRTKTQTYNIFADMWLEYRYGWRQLYFSSRDVAQSFDVLSQDKHFVVNTGRAYSSKVENGTCGATYNNAWGQTQALSKTASTTLEQRAVVSLQVYKALAALDFNLVGLGYELVPYSFVLDWFVNVGDVARASWPVPHVKRTAATSWKKTHKAVVARRHLSEPCSFSALATGLYTHTREEYRRTPHEGEIPVVFDVNPRLGLSRILDLVSLAVGGYNRHDSNSWRNSRHLRI